MKTNSRESAMTQFNQLYENAPIVASKWKKELNSINEAFDGKLDYQKQIATAILLENTNNHLNKLNYMTEATQPSDVGFFKNYAINLLSAVMPNLLAQDLVSVQPIQSAVGEVRFLDILYGSDKGKIKRGQIMNSARGLGQLDPSYSSDQVIDEYIDAKSTSVEATLAWLPVVPGTVEFTDADKVYKDDGKGKIVGTGVTDGTIDYATGKVTLTLGAAPAENILGVNYVYDNMNVPVSAPEVNLKISVAPIIARSRKLKTVYSFDAAFNMSQDYGMQINNELLAYTAAQLKHEIDGEIMADLYKMASAKAVTWDATPREGISVRDHNESLYNAIVQASNNIYDATQVAVGSFVIVGTEAATIIETLPRFTSQGAMNPQGPYICGYLGSMPVVKNPTYPKDTFLVGWKGDSLFDTGYIYAPYMPILTTNLIVDADFQGQRGFATSYGKKMVNSNMYATGKITRS